MVQPICVGWDISRITAHCQTFFLTPYEPSLKISFVLVEPEHPGNIGAVARALHTMGFTDLRLVRPCEYHESEALWLAHGSQDTLTSALEYNDLEAALAGVDFVVGTSAREHRYKYAYQSSRTLQTFLSAKQDAVGHIALVFGRESSGLTNKELQLCDIVSVIPSHTPYPSLNLSHAVMIYAYELAQNAQIQQQRNSFERKPTGAEYHALKKHCSTFLRTIGVEPETTLYRRSLERLALLNKDDLDLVQYLRRMVMRYVAIRCRRADGR